MFNKLLVLMVVAGAAMGFLLTPAKPRPVVGPAPIASGIKPLETVLKRNSDGHFYVDALVNDQSIHFLIDTGATDVALTGEDADRIGINPASVSNDVVGSGASGDVHGMNITVHHIAIDQKEAFDIPAVVIPRGLDVSLLGQAFLAQVGSVSIVNDRMILK